jgi:hypothetical protein
MNGPLLLFVGAIYLYVAGEFIYTGKIGLAIAFFAYALANVGFWIASRS